MTIFEYFNINISFYLFSLEEILIVFFLFSLSKLVILGIVMELIWPTHFFNKRHNINYYSIKIRDYTSVLLKLKTKSKVYYTLKILWTFFKFRC